MAPKNDYLINYGGEIFIIKASEEEIRAWRCEEVEQKKQSPQVQRRKDI